MSRQQNNRNPVHHRPIVRLGHALQRIVKRSTPTYFPIAYKLALIITLLITSGMVILGLVIVKNQTQLLRTQINDFGQAVVTQLAESAKELVMSDDELSLMTVVNNLGSSKNILGAVIYSENGKVLAVSGILPGDDISGLYAKASRIDDKNYSVAWKASDDEGKVINAISFIEPVRFKNVIAGHALVTFSKGAMDQSLHDTVIAIIMATALMILLGIMVAFYLGDLLSKPIRRLMDASKAIDSGQYDYRIHERRNDEIGYLTEAFNQLAANMLEKSQVENAFSRFVSTNVAKKIMANLDQIKLGGKHVNGSVLFADIVGFTSLSEQLPADEVASLLNEYFTYISMATDLYHGTIDKYMGDCAMIVFGVPDEDPDNKFHAVACAVMIQQLVNRLNAIRIKNNKVAIHFRIGVNSGTMLAGNMGSSQRMQFTVVGETVNLASRLHTVAGADQVIITEHLYKSRNIQSRIQAYSHKSIKLRGIAEPVSTYIVTNLAAGYQSTIDAQITEILASRDVA